MLTLHIGRRKTGSTSLQFYLLKNAQRLEELGIVYPQAGRPGRSHHLLAKVFKNSDFMTDESEDAWGGLREAMRERPEARFVISSEALEFANARKVLKTCGTEDVSVICDLRPTPAHQLSAFDPSTKYGINTPDLDSDFKASAEEGH